MNAVIFMTIIWWKYSILIECMPVRFPIFLQNKEISLWLYLLEAVVIVFKICEKTEHNCGLCSGCLTWQLIFIVVFLIFEHHAVKEKQWVSLKVTNSKWRTLWPNFHDKRSLLWAHTGLSGSEDENRPGKQLEWPLRWQQ